MKKQRKRVSINKHLHAKLKEIAEDKGITIPAVLALMVEFNLNGSPVTESNYRSDKKAKKESKKGKAKSNTNADVPLLERLKNERAEKQKAAKNRVDKLYGEGN